MDKLSKINLKTLIALSLIGYVLVLLIRYFESILSSLSEIAALFLLSNSKYFDFYEIIPRLIIVSLWAVLVFKYLNNFSGEINLSNDLTKKFTSRLIILGLILLIIQFALTYLADYIWTLKRIQAEVDYQFISIKTLIINLLGIIEIAIIVIGYFKIIKKTTAANKR